jgi:ubiquinone/menaquinone biosynthesis C-methylase UbiE
MEIPTGNFHPTIERFSGFAGLYDQYRPKPPAILAELLSVVAGTRTPELVVDLGCGTGLSTRYWADKAQQVIGIDPSPDMLRQAEQVTQAANIAYRAGYSHATGLPDGCATLVTCSQSLHWMEPQATFDEARRICRPGGVFAAFDYDWPPTTTSWEADQTFTECMARVWQVEDAQRDGPQAKLLRWEKEEHLQRMQASGCFRYAKEVVIHHIEPGNAERLVGLALGQGSTAGLLKQGFSEQALGLDLLAAVAERTLGDAMQPWYWSSRIRFGVI